MIVYFRKEGRSLGEVIKYRVYNARKAQPGGVRGGGQLPGPCESHALSLGTSSAAQDTPENYFRVTESIAGIRDARFQEMMAGAAAPPDSPPPGAFCTPLLLLARGVLADVLLFLGIRRIDWLLSMSGDKYDAIVSAGIEVMQRVPLPDVYVPKGATVEITVRGAAGRCATSLFSPVHFMTPSTGQDRLGVPHRVDRPRVCHQ